MAPDPPCAAGGLVTTLEDLPDDTRSALCGGFAFGHWWIEGIQDSGSSDLELDKQAFEDGQRLGASVSMLISADLVDYAADKNHYDRLADELDARYGAGLVVGSDELGPTGPSPGFRTRTQPGP